MDLTQTADTGQYVLGTTNTYANLPNDGGTLAFQIYRLNDEFISTNPLFVKVQLNATQGFKAVGFTIGSTITVGTATDGLGNITNNSVSHTVICGYPYTKDFFNAAYQSFATTIPPKGFFAVVFNAGLQEPPYDMRFAPVAFCIERIPNEDGSPSNTGFTLFSSGLNYTNNSSVNSNGAFGNVNVCVSKTVRFSDSKTFEHAFGAPFFAQSSFVDGALINHFYHTTPMPIRSSCVGSILANKLGKGTQFAATVYGNTPTNFIVMDGFCAFRPTSIVNANLVFAFE
ncbi:hypothetical protein ACG94X_02450 [Acinetobacter sp. ULE_I010]|uniref:hypothetical protein n=1 Tax=Acinetobacter sp. ULE_I010 TaxID=3373065 RepID=UPI003AF530C6